MMKSKEQIQERINEIRKQVKDLGFSARNKYNNMIAELLWVIDD